MGLISLIKQILKNKEIERNATGREAYAIDLINEYADRINIACMNLPPKLPVTVSLPPPLFYTKGVKNSDYKHDPMKSCTFTIPKSKNQPYCIIEDFLTKYPDYQTRNAEKIRKWYEL